uniref:Uncharacterized protein n=1 Tax=Thermosporothrix sp. COM3 TaxID=2490863 RepID=A0A455SRC5_9CHLR|nr:hypothetical protein KTC_48620 [Thermosporothrix sp. COM3]BBH90176.1 hypothetical protein KTC_49270 [Thermosporothrix sp. COM3]BBH90241.1 hypothetical protein KTC_49920 [Thermosporothrix sp. COM3]
MTTIEQINNLIICQGTLPLPPSINRSYQVVSGTRRLASSPKAKQFKEEAAWMLQANAQVNWEAVRVIRENKQKTPLQMTLKFYLPSLWMRDIDGGIKISQDAVFNFLGLNDNLVVDLRAAKAVDKERPRTEIEVSCK